MQYPFTHFIFLIFLCFAGIAFADYSTHPKAKILLQEMAAEHNDDVDQLQTYLQSAKKQVSVLNAISKPAERLSWEKYSKIFLTEKRVQAGLAFMAQYKDLLRDAEQRYGVDAYIITAIIGVETFYGQHMGSYRVLDALATLAFEDTRRSRFFYKELKSFLLLIREQKLNITELKGSYAGAMGWPQFMPSSFTAYAVDFDQDGQKNFWTTPADAIGSVANYLARHGWEKDAPILISAKMNNKHSAKAADVINQSLKPRWSQAELAQAYGIVPEIHHKNKTLLTPIQLNNQAGQPMELWLGFQNFYAISRYNHSRLYVMAVYKLSESLARYSTGSQNQLPKP